MANRQLCPLMPRGVLYTLELNTANAPEEVQAGADLLLRPGLAGRAADGASADGASANSASATDR